MNIADTFANKVTRDFKSIFEKEEIKIANQQIFRVLKIRAKLINVSQN